MFQRKRYCRLVLIGTVFSLLPGCGGPDGTAPPIEEDPEPANVTISPNAATLEAFGSTTQFTATVRDKQGREMTGFSITWNSADPLVASITSTGLATAHRDGLATIIAIATPTVSGWASVTVDAVPLEIITGTLPVGIVGEFYDLTLEAVGAGSPQWSVIGGDLPLGLSLDPSSGRISGTPLEAGFNGFIIQLSSGGHNVSRAMNIPTIPGNLGIGFGDDQFVLIPAGSFQMGSENGAADEEPVHTVNITQPFYLQKTEVTQGQWLEVMGSNPSAFKACGNTCPVERVSWEAIQTFILALNAANPGANYRLPTEAEWEYAARAGTTGDYGGTGNLDEMGWYDANSGRKTVFVGFKQPNAWGLYDMHGNVFEWVLDWYSADYYGVSPENDPQGPPEGTRRVIRGGSVDQNAGQARSANRQNSNPSSPGFTIYYGFRLARTP